MLVLGNYSRTASGVIMMRLGEGQKLVNFTKVKKNDDSDESADTTDAIETVEIDETDVQDFDIAPTEE